MLHVIENTPEGLRAIEGIRDRWLNGKITTDQFIREAEAQLLMLELAR